MTTTFSRLQVWGGLGLCCALLTMGCAPLPTQPTTPAAVPAVASTQHVAEPMAPMPLPLKVTGPSPAPAEAVPVETPVAPVQAVAVNAAPLHFEQAWDVVEVMGKPVAAGEPAARVVFRGQGGLLVDGGCNQFSGRVERDEQGQLRVSRYSGSHRECDVPARAEAVLNSALIMTTHYQQRGQALELRNADGLTLVRLVPSANQDVQSLERAVARAAPTPSHGKSGKVAKSAKGAKALAHGKGKSSTKVASGKSGASGHGSSKPGKSKKKAS